MAKVFEDTDVKMETLKTAVVNTAAAIYIPALIDPLKAAVVDIFKRLEQYDKLCQTFEKQAADGAEAIKQRDAALTRVHELTSDLEAAGGRPRALKERKAKLKEESKRVKEQLEEIDLQLKELEEEPSNEME